MENIVRDVLGEAERTLAREEPVSYLQDGDDFLGAATESVMIKVAMDSGSVDNVINPAELPCDSAPDGKPNGRNFVGAGGDPILKYGACKTNLEGKHGMVGCKWQVADVTKPLHSVSKVTGPADGPGTQDVLFNNQRCVVVPPGVVDEVLKKVKPVAEYLREGGLYTAEMKMTSFAGRGQA